MAQGGHCCAAANPGEQPLFSLLKKNNVSQLAQAFVTLSYIPVSKNNSNACKTDHTS